MIATLIIILLRLVIPISIFRWPLAGGIIAMLLDAVDVVLVDFLADFLGEERGFQLNYHTLDKWLDMYYLTFELFVSFRWTNALARNTSIALFVAAKHSNTLELFSTAVISSVHL